MRMVWRGLRWLLLLLLLLLLLIAALLGWHLLGSRAKLEGEVAAAALAAPVTVQRDGSGIPTITASTRSDAAYALGYLHAQERFFQMDMLRRAAAGELSELSGAATEKIDRAIRPHRFKARARAIVAAMPGDERRLLDRYVEGVNQGRSELSSSPFEYALLQARPRAWAPEDTILAVYAMYINLQAVTPQQELDRALAERRGGRALAELLYPSSTELDAPIDGSRLPLPGLPERLLPSPRPVPDRALAPAPVMAEEPVPGSNSWAVAGRLSSTGSALVANDMHLGLSVPGTWYRARIIVRPPGSRRPALDVTGVTLPGTPSVTAGSNGRIAWGFTNSMIDTIDAVVVEPVPGRPGYYQTPEGPRPIVRVTERLCIGGDCEDFPVEETIWGPIVATDAFGRRIAQRWTAHEAGAIRLLPAIALENAESVEEAMALARRASIPQQNLVVGDRAGNVGWTIIGRVPARFGFDGRYAVSFADGSRGWRGMLPDDQVPVVLNPDEGRIWTANARVVGGEAFARLGDGGYDNGSRAGRIRDLLFAQQRFAPADFLRIQLDTVSRRNAFWQQAMLGELQKRRSETRLAPMIEPVRSWGGRADPGSVGYRLVAVYRIAFSRLAHEAYLGGKPEGRLTHAQPQGDGGMRALARAQPGTLVPPGHRSWTAFIDAVFADVARQVEEAAGGRLDRFTWGAYSKARVQHPLARAIPGLGWLTDPDDMEVAGDSGVVRAQAPGFGASERFAVSPGHEAHGIFHMPGSQSSNPLSPYYLRGHEDWLHGRAAPFLPGPARWTLRFSPAR